jgi:excisionase family DNA binding protein
MEKVDREWVLYHEEENKLWVVDEIDLLMWRALSDDSDDPNNPYNRTYYDNLAVGDDPDGDHEFLDVFDDLGRYGWARAEPLAIAMALGEVHDEASALAWSRGKPDQAALIARLEQAVDRMEADRKPSAPAEALPLKEAAAFMGVELSTLAHLIKSRKIPYVQVGTQRGRVLRVMDMRKFMDEHTVITAEEALRKRGSRRESRSP